MSNWYSDYIVTNGLKIHYYCTGGQKPPVVLNHGAGDDGLCWTRVAKTLELDYNVIMPDARGHGKSASGEGDYSTSQRAADLAGLIQSLKLDRPVVGGHSMGADASLCLAADYPELTRGIFLEDPPIILPGEKIGGDQAIKAEDIGKMMAKFMRTLKLLPRFIGSHLAKKALPDLPEDEFEPWLDSKKRVSLNFLNTLSTLQIINPDPFEEFRKVNVPVLLFIGDREKMSIVSQETAREAVRVNPLVQVVHLEGASHDIRRTRFNGYIPVLKQFLAGLYP